MPQVRLPVPANVIHHREQLMDTIHRQFPHARLRVLPAINRCLCRLLETMASALAADGVEGQTYQCTGNQRGYVSDWTPDPGLTRGLPTTDEPGSTANRLWGVPPALHDDLQRD
jgi:hypothetical protein